MQFLKNKHLIVAMLVAPVLAVIAYFGVDHLVSEKPHSAQQGKSYRLAAKSNCRYQSGLCTLQNGDIKVQLSAQRTGQNQIELTLSSDLKIQNAVVSFVDEHETSEPTQMQPLSPESDTWHSQLKMTSPEQGNLRLALSIANTLYFAETSAIFIDYKTSFSQDNFPR